VLSAEGTGTQHPAPSTQHSALRASRRAALGLLIAPALIACGGPREATRTPAPAFVGPDVAAQRLGQQVRVRMRVQCVDVGSRVAPTCVRPTCYYEGFLFRVCIPPQLTDQFEQELRGPIGERMLERVVDAVGVVQQNGQWAEIVVTSTEQLKIASGLRPPLEPTRVPARPKS
jgi:hypothetical protein